MAFESDLSTAAADITNTGMNWERLSAEQQKRAANVAIQYAEDTSLEIKSSDVSNLALVQYITAPHVSIDGKSLSEHAGSNRRAADEFKFMAELAAGKEGLNLDAQWAAREHILDAVDKNLKQEKPGEKTEVADKAKASSVQGNVGTAGSAQDLAALRESINALLAGNISESVRRMAMQILADIAARMEQLAGTPKSASLGEGNSGKTSKRGSGGGGTKDGQKPSIKEISAAVISAQARHVATEQGSNFDELFRAQLAKANIVLEENDIEAIVAQQKKISDEIQKTANGQKTSNTTSATLGEHSPSRNSSYSTSGSRVTSHVDQVSKANSQHANNTADISRRVVDSWVDEHKRRETEKAQAKTSSIAGPV